jgi:hypothetical protein
MHRDKPGEPGWSDKTPVWTDKQELEVTGKERAPLTLTLEMVRQDRVVGSGR